MTTMTPVAASLIADDDDDDNNNRLLRPQATTMRPYCWLLMALECG